MGTKVQSKSYLPGYHLMGDLNEDSKSDTWPIHYRDKPLSNGQFHNPEFQRTTANAYFGYHTETVRQKMLEHEAIFKTQLYELHRVYNVQRELMDDLKMNELQKQSMALETSMSSCSASQRLDAQRWLSSSSCAKPAVVGEKDFHSTPNFLSGKSLPNGMVSPSNAGSSKDSEVEITECRPSKTRRKFDLELRADEYIDAEEPKYQSNKPHGVLNHPSYITSKDLTSSGTKMFLGGSIEIDRQQDEARQNKRENGLVDLNEQIQIQGLNSASHNFFGCDSNFRPKPQLQTPQKDYMQNSHYGRDDCMSRMLDSARSKGQTKNISQNFLPENIDLFSKNHDASYWKERSEGGPKLFGNNFFDRLSNPQQLDKSFLTSKAPWESSGCCVTQKCLTAEMHPCFNSTSTLPQKSQSSDKSTWTLGEGWHINSGSRINAAYQNGFYNRSYSGSGSACRSTVGSDYFNRSNNSYMASGVRACQSGSIDLNSLMTTVDARDAKGIDLNVSSIVDNDYVARPKQDSDADLPWLKSHASFMSGNGSIQSSNSGVARLNTGPGSSPGMENTGKRILGVPIFGESHLSKGASSCRSSLSKEEETDKNGRVRGFDMNLPYEYEDNVKEARVAKKINQIDLNMCLADDDDAVMTPSTPGNHHSKTIRGFDLEAPGEMEEEDSDDEGIVTAAAEAIVGISSCRKLTLTETPAKSPPKASLDALEWFVDIISSCPDDGDKVLSSDSVEEESDSVDYFEHMTLQLPVTNEDEYLPDYPKPPELQEHTGAGLYMTKTRKGQARRGRPRRDFQRDILPGLTSLARHEVTEDLQRFVGLMRATGHSWKSSLTRRGRPRLTPLQPPSPASLTCPSTPLKKPVAPCPASSPSTTQKRRTITSGDEFINIEDHGSLTGWGKTTRRPRRQPRRQGCATTSVLQQIA